MEPKTFDTPDGVRLDIRIPAGEIEIEATDTATTTLEIENERDPQEFRIEFNPHPDGGHRLLVEQRGRRFGIGLGLRRELSVRIGAPTGAHVAVETGSADLTVRGTAGSLTFRSGSGDLSFEHVSGDATVNVASGDASGGAVEGDLIFHSASGDLGIGPVGGEAIANTASGDVRIGSVRRNLRSATASGDVQIGALSAGESSIRSVSGDVAVGVARGTRVWLDLSSVSGSTTSDLAMSDASPGDVQAELELRASTVSGDIRVRRAADEREPA